MGFKENVTIWEGQAKSWKILEAAVGCGLGWGFVLFVLGFLRCKENKAVISVSLSQLCQINYVLCRRPFTFLVNYLPGIGVFFRRYLSLWLPLRLPLIVTGVLYKNRLNSVEDVFGLFSSIGKMSIQVIVRMVMWHQSLKISCIRSCLIYKEQEGRETILWELLRTAVFLTEQ